MIPAAITRPAMTPEILSQMAGGWASGELPPYILTEDGDRILTEDGLKLLIVEQDDD